VFGISLAKRLAIGLSFDAGTGNGDGGEYGPSVDGMHGHADQLGSVLIGKVGVARCRHPVAGWLGPRSPPPQVGVRDVIRLARAISGRGPSPSA
jgi:hypothetical protein